MLNKAQFLRGRSCSRRLWLDLNRPELQPDISDADLDRMKVGQFIGELARLNYPSGVMVPRKPTLEDAAAATQALIEAGHRCLFEATFIAEGKAARVDILTWSEEGWIIDEVKSSTLKPVPKIAFDKVEDLAFQLLVLRRAGLRVSQARLVLVDSSIRWDGDPAGFANLLSPLDLTERCEKILRDLELDAERVSRALTSETRPEVELNTHCKGCEYFEHCFEGQGLDDVIFLPKITAQEVRRLRQQDYSSIRSIPEDYKLNPKQHRVRAVIQNGAPFVSEELGGCLAGIRYPAVFVDFETAASAIPLYPGTRPYEQVCFQWSAHVAPAAYALVEHYDFLAEGHEDPRQEFCRTLWNVVKGCRSVVHYTAFEITQLRVMADQAIPYAQELLDAFLENSLDLEKVIAEHVYFEGFRGRTSIKVVLPTLVPSMTYKHLRIADGNAAACAFRLALDPSVDPQDVAAIRTALLEYCCQDTLAMVEIYRALCELESTGARSVQTASC